MLELAQQLSYYLSVVDGGASSKLVEMGQKLASVGVIATMAQSSIQGMIAPINAVAAAWSGREQQINNISRSLRQYQYVGNSIVDINRQIAESMPGSSVTARGETFSKVYMAQFEDARQFSRGIIGQMSRLAAVLPGELNDYMQSFSQNLPHLSRATGMTIGRAANLTSYLTAGGISAGIDAGQSSRDLMQALTTGAHIVDRSWTEVWSQYARFKGRRIDTAGFNRLTLDNKVRVLEDIADQLKPMMQATGSSWEALIGTFNSYRHELYLAATEPIFDQWKVMLSGVNNILGELTPGLSTVTEFFAKKLAHAMDGLYVKMKALPAAIDRLTASFVAHLPAWNGIFQGAKQFLGGAGGAIGGFLGGAGRHVRGAMAAHDVGGGTLLNMALPVVLGRVLGVAFGPVGMIVGGIFTRLLTGGGLAPILTSLAGGLMLILPPLFQFGFMLFRLYDGLMTMAAMIVGVVLPPLIMIASTILGMILPVLVSMANVFVNFLLLPIIGLMPIVLTAFMGIATIVEVVAIGWRMIAGLFGILNTETFDVIDAFRQISDFFQEFAVELRESLYYLLHEIGSMSDEEYSASMTRIHAEPPGMPAWMADLQAAIRRAGTDAADMNQRGHTDRNRQHRPSSVQDFRYSRFDVTNKFAAGFDPDRVASAFVSDLESLAEQRLGSGFGPAYGTP